MNKSTVNRNSKGQRHGYNDFYYNGKLSTKRFYYNGNPIDYQEMYWRGQLEKTFYI